MLEDFESLADAMLKLKEQDAIEDFLNATFKEDQSGAQAFMENSSKAKMMVALAGLDDAALSAIDVLEKLDGREEVQEQLSV